MRFEVTREKTVQEEERAIVEAGGLVDAVNEAERLSDSGDTRHDNAQTVSTGAWTVRPLDEPDARETAAAMLRAAGALHHEPGRFEMVSRLVIPELRALGIAAETDRHNETIEVPMPGDWLVILGLSNPPRWGYSVLDARGAAAKIAGHDGVAIIGTEPERSVLEQAATIIHAVRSLQAHRAIDVITYEAAELIGTRLYALLPTATSGDIQPGYVETLGKEAAKFARAWAINNVPGFAG